MHSLILVVGPSVHAQLAPYADHRKVERYRVEVEGDGLASMAEHFGLADDDLPGLAAKMPEWNEAEGEVHAGRLTFWSRENPQAKFDWYTIGGRFSGYLRLLDPRAPSFLGRLLGKKPTDRVDQARKRELVLDHVLDDPPVGLVANGSWIDRGWSADEAADEQWKQQFAERFRRVDDDELVTVVDLHS